MSRLTPAVMAPLLTRQEAVIADLVDAGWPRGDRLARACVRHVLAWATWRSLAIEGGLADAEIVDLMTGLIARASDQAGV